MSEPTTHAGSGSMSVKILDCIVVTPEATVLETPATFVVLPLFDGEIGIAPGHSPMIGRLGYGEMRIVEGNLIRRYYVDGGFVQVADNVVSVLTNRAVKAENLPDVATLNAQLAEARALPAHSPAAMEIRDRAVSQARAQLRVVGRAQSGGRLS